MNGPNRRRSRSATSTNLPLDIEVAWADITKVQSDVLVAGKYMDLLPQNALRSLDLLVSRGNGSRQLLTDLTRRGALRCAVGDVHFFPCGSSCQVLVVGMGRQGLFGTSQLARAAQCAAEAVGSVMGGKTVSTILMGTGARNMEVRDAVDGLVCGFVQAMRADPTLSFERLRIVERNLVRAFEIVDMLRVLALTPRYVEQIRVESKLVEPDGGEGQIPTQYGFSMLLGAVARAWAEGTENTLYPSAKALCDTLPDGVRERIAQKLTEGESDVDPRRDGLRFRISDGSPTKDPENPDRVTFAQDGRQIRSAAMTNLATVTERVLAMKPRWIDRIADDLRAAAHVEGQQTIEDRCRNAYRNLIHPEIREKVAEDGPLVIEVDRRLAAVPWEMLQDTPESDPLAVRRPIARQLRTIYSPRVSVAESSEKPTALVIGDPDDTLEAARNEAAAVAKLLRGRGLSVDVCIGRPNRLGRGQFMLSDEPKQFADPADLFRIIERLQSYRYDVVHFSGHAVFSPETPDVSGWLFADGDVLTPAMLENTESPPRLIFANACLSAGLSQGSANRSIQGTSEAGMPTSDGPDPYASRGDALLVASLADEFLRRGAADYVGTAWLVPDEPARAFAETFYDVLLGGKALGAAVREAREKLYRERQVNGIWETSWAAYQHYGDPTRRLTLEDRPSA